MSATDTAAIFDYHRNMIAFHGNTGPAALGWTDLESQQIRFKVLAQLADVNNCTILDAGCGHADLLAYLLPLYPQVKYIGIEQIPELLNEATKRYRHLPQATFIQGDLMSDITVTCDQVFASGSLNYFHSEPDFIFKAINKLFSMCSVGLAFNLLNHIIPNGLLVAYDPKVIIAYCQTLSSKVKLLSDHSDEDFTIFMYH